MADFITAIKMMLGSTKHLIIFGASSILFSGIFLYSITTPLPYDRLLALSLTPLSSLVLDLLISLLSGLTIGLSIYSMDLSKSKSSGVAGLGGSVSGLIGGVFASAGCISCLGAVFGFLGVGTLLTLSYYTWYFIGLSLILMGFSIYSSSKKICSNCKC